MFRLKNHHGCLSLVLLMGSVGSAAGQSSILWEATFDGSGAPGIQSDVSLLDPVGRVFVVGHNSGVAPNTLHLQLLRADGSSAFTKTRSLTGLKLTLPVQATLGSGRGLMVAFSAGPAAGGSTDARVDRFDGQGNLVWEKTFDGPSHLGERVNGIACLGTDTYVVGTTERPSGTFTLDDIFINRYDSNGGLTWSRIITCNTNTTLVRGPAFDSSGNLVIAVHGERQLKKLDPAGQEIWSVDLPTGIDALHVPNPELPPIVGAGDRIIVIGSFLKTDVSDIDPMALSYDKDGTLQFKHTFDTGDRSQSRVVDAALTQDGDLYLGISIGDQISFDEFSEKLQRLDKTGTVRMDLALDRPVLGLEIDAARNVYAVSTTPQIDNLNNLILKKFDAAGTQLWVQPIKPSPGERTSPPIALHLGPEASLYLSFNSSKHVAADLVSFWKVVRLAPSRFFAKQVVVGTNGLARVLWERFDGGEALTQKLDGSGGILQQRTFVPPPGFRVKAFAIGRANSMMAVLFAGVAGTSNAGRALLLPVTDDLVQHAGFITRAYAGTPTSVAVDGADRVWISHESHRGVTQGSLHLTTTDITLRKINLAFNDIERTRTYNRLSGLPQHLSISAGNDNRVRSLVGMSIGAFHPAELVTLGLNSHKGTHSFLLDSATQSFQVESATDKIPVAASTGTDNRTRVLFRLLSDSPDAVAFLWQVQPAGTSRFGAFAITKSAGDPVSIGMSLHPGAASQGMVLFRTEGGAAQIKTLDFDAMASLSPFILPPVFVTP